MSKKIWNSIVYAVLGLCLLATPGRSQPEMGPVDDNQGPYFHFDTINFAVPGNNSLCRLFIFVEVVNDELQFVKLPEQYQASYEVSAVVYDKDDNQVDGTSWKETVVAPSFEFTNKRTWYSQSYRTFDLEPGRYEISLTVQDLETKRSTERKTKIQLRDFNQNKLMLSEVGLVSEIVVDSSGVQSIRPQVSDPAKGISDSSFAFFEIYNPEGLSEVAIDWEIFGNTVRKKISGHHVKALHGPRTYDYIPLRADSLAHDSYTLTITARHGEERYKVTKPFYVRWSMLPATATDLNTVVEQVRYLATKEEWKKLNKAKGEQRLKEFIAFWQRRDPTPGTEANEAMESYYARVEYANQHFSGMQRAGWRSDMGIVYIILGGPDDIERNAYPRSSKPYEIWYYYRISRQFLFYDYTGFGDYRLETPYSIYEFQRLLNN